MLIPDRGVRCVPLRNMENGFPVMQPLQQELRQELHTELVSRNETTVLELKNRTSPVIANMVGKGLFGEIVHVQCGYQHDLREVLGTQDRHYRTAHYIQRNADNYPTHGLGPWAKVLGINRGNRFMTLTSMASKARGFHEWAELHLGKEHPLANSIIAQGDIVTTMIKCAHGETISITLDTTLPRPYSRAGRVQGTKGIWKMVAGSFQRILRQICFGTWRAMIALRSG